MNPWHDTLLQRLRDLIRFLLWSSLTINCGIACYYSVLFTNRFFRHAWDWACKTLFLEPW